MDSNSTNGNDPEPSNNTPMREGTYSDPSDSSEDELSYDHINPFEHKDVDTFYNMNDEAMATTITSDPFTEAYTKRENSYEYMNGASPQTSSATSDSDEFTNDRRDYLPIDQSIGLLDAPDKENLADIFSYLDNDPRHLQFIIDQYERLHLDYEATIRAGHISSSESESSDSRTSDTEFNSISKINRYTTKLNGTNPHQKGNSSPEFDDSINNNLMNETAQNYHQNADIHYSVNLSDENSSYVELGGEFSDLPDITRIALEFQRANQDQDTSIINDQIDEINNHMDETKDEQTYDTGELNTNPFIDESNFNNISNSPWDIFDYTDFFEAQFLPNINHNFTSEDVWENPDEPSSLDAEFKETHTSSPDANTSSTNSSKGTIELPYQTPEHVNQNIESTQTLEDTTDSNFNGNPIYLSEEAKNIIQTTMASINLTIPPSFRSFHRKTF